jgi:hypothetical protein
MRDLAMKKNARSNMNAIKAIAAAKPEMQVEQQAMDISRTWASSPNTAEMAERMRATTWRKSAYVSHLTTTSGIFIGKSFPTRALMSETQTLVYIEKEHFGVISLLSSYPICGDVQLVFCPAISRQYPRVPNVIDPFMLSTSKDALRKKTDLK